MIKYSKKRLVVSVILIAVLSMLNPAQSAGLPTQGSMNPSQWPNNPGISPNMEGWPNAIRLWGEDRYQTSLSSLLMMRVMAAFRIALQILRLAVHETSQKPMVGGG